MTRASAGTVTAAPAGEPFRVQVQLDRVQPWWPGNIGKPQQYRVGLELHGMARTLDHVERQVGFRQLDFDFAAAAVRLNGRRFRLVQRPLVLGKGDDPLSAAVAAEETAVAPGSAEVVTLLCRDWVPHPAVNDLADEQGLLIRQSFPLRGGGSGDTAFGGEVARQARVLTHLLGHHACIACWHSPQGAGGAGRAEQTLCEAITAGDPTRRCIVADGP